MCAVWDRWPDGFFFVRNIDNYFYYMGFCCSFGMKDISIHEMEGLWD